MILNLLLTVFMAGAEGDLPPNTDESLINAAVEDLKRCCSEEGVKCRPGNTASTAMSGTTDFKNCYKLGSGRLAGRDEAMSKYAKQSFQDVLHSSSGKTRHKRSQSAPSTQPAAQ